MWFSDFECSMLGKSSLIIFSHRLVERVGLFLFRCFNLFPCNCDKALWQTSLTGKKALLLLTAQRHSLPQQRAKGSKSLKHLVVLHSQPGNRRQQMFLLSKISPFDSLQNPNLGNGTTQFLWGYYHLNLIKTMPRSHSQTLTAVSGGRHVIPSPVKLAMEYYIYCSWWLLKNWYPPNLR